MFTSTFHFVQHRVTGVRFAWNLRDNGHIAMHVGTTESFMGSECRAPLVFLTIAEIFSLLKTTREDHPEEAMAQVMWRAECEDKYISLL